MQLGKAASHNQQELRLIKNSEGIGTLYPFEIIPDKQRGITTTQSNVALSKSAVADEGQRGHRHATTARGGKAL